ncbi:MAG: hypothetical protein HY749_21170 [Gammaproteobacteria bacterium]|nr:hypothetical protein [Gammaproteobacteria bacterium]
MESKINAAIAAKKVLSFSYRGLPRIVEPHAYGIHDGIAQILGYQIRGRSSTGAVPDWRRFQLRDIQSLQTLDEGFPGRRSSPSGKHSHWDRLIAVVD